MVRKHIPKYRHKKTTNRAVATLNGRDHWLGTWDTAESRTAYDRLILLWIANRRRPAQRQLLLPIDDN